MVFSYEDEVRELNIMKNIAPFPCVVWVITEKKKHHPIIIRAEIERWQIGRHYNGKRVAAKVKGDWKWMEERGIRWGGATFPAESFGTNVFYCEADAKEYLNIKEE